VFTAGFVIGVRLYDKRLFETSRLRHLASAHPGLLSAGAGPVPLLHAARTAGPPGLRLSGESDLSNRRALQAVVQHLVEDATAAGVPVTIDVSDLRFADGHTARILIGAAKAAGGMRLIGCSPALIRLLGFQGAASTPGLILR
jgi:anti-anti-sigma regulatory factor